MHWTLLVTVNRAEIRAKGNLEIKLTYLLVYINFVDGTTDNLD